MKTLLVRFAPVVAVVILLLSSQNILAEGTTAFTYQGQLNDGGTNANGTYTMIFALYDSLSGGNLIAGPITETSTLANGLFTLNLDFGAAAFNGSARYLDITVQSGSDSQELSPRVQVMPAPYAIFACTASNITGVLPAGQLTNTLASAQLSGAYSNTLTFNNTNNTFSGAGAGLTNLNPANLSAGTAAINITGAAASATTATFATNLSNGTWSTSVGTVDGYANAFGIYDNNSLMMGMTSSGDVVLVPNDGTFTVGIIPGQLAINGSIYMNGGPIYDVGELDPVDNSDITINGDVVMGGGDGQPGSIYSADFTESLFFGTDALNVNGGLNVFGDINADNVYAGNLSYNDGGDGGDDAIMAKATVASTNSLDVLSHVVQLNISNWSSKKDPKTHHIGPRAHDFQTAFGLGEDGKTISLIDETGVALAAIQGLNEKLKQKDAQIESLEKRLSDLEQLGKKTAAQK